MNYKNILENTQIKNFGDCLQLRYPKFECLCNRKNEKLTGVVFRPIRTLIAHFADEHGYRNVEFFIGNENEYRFRFNVKRELKDVV